MSENIKPRILIVEDDRRLSMVNSRALELDGYEITTAFTLSEARPALAAISPDVILLDVKLPDGSGFDFCREIREHTTAYIIFLTSVTEAEGEFEGLVAGGDDYLRKPYGIELLQERVKRALRRERQTPQIPHIIEYGSLTFDIVADMVYLNGADLMLTQKEFSLLLLLAQNEDGVLSAVHLYEKVWRQPMLSEAQSIKNTISRLRKKLEGSGYEISAERGEGYSFRNK